MHSIKIIAVLIALLIAGCKEPKKTESFRYFRNYSRTFNDMNDRHVKAARQWGIKPVTSVGELKKLKGKVVQLKSCRWYELDELTHSQPYLVLKAHDLLKTIGRNFKDSLEARGLPSYKIVVTSVLRTNESIMKLRKRISMPVPIRPTCSGPLLILPMLVSGRKIQTGHLSKNSNPY